MATAIQIENLSKQYRLGQVGTGTISHDLNRFFAKLRGKEDPFLKIGEANDRTKSGDSNLVWALKDINFSVEQGDIVGIIGKNGAGKSTLLKILSKVTGPTKGSIKARGRIASLLEVGTGFHPELTGRENIFLNGAILGMSKHEIKSKIDEIVSFAGIERYLDTPVKRYSSGMMVRLGFAVAAHLEPEILVVDEVLAVGDAEFQKKAIGKMQEVSTNQGRTVLFVSHNMGAVGQLCSRAVVIEQGTTGFIGEVQDGINHYLSSSSEYSGYLKVDDSQNLEQFGKRDLTKILSVATKKLDGTVSGDFFIGEVLTIELEVEFMKELKNPEIGFAISNNQRTRLIHHASNWVCEDHTSSIKKTKYTVRMPALNLYPGSYSITVWTRRKKGEIVDDYLEAALTLNVINTKEFENIDFSQLNQGGILTNCDWKIE